jgi:hypothetical protein
VRREALPTGPVPIDSGVVELRWCPHRPAGVTVLVNGAESSYLDLADPAWLEFEYMQQIVAVIDEVVPAGAPLRAVHLGGAGCALPRALDARRPGSRQVAVEIDATLAANARAWFALPPAPRLRLRVGDARAVVETLRPASQDVVVRDVFAGSAVPRHVRTAEFAAHVARSLRPDGVYVANTADYPPLLETRRDAATVATAFPHTAVIAEPGIVRGRRYGNLVIVASHAPLPVTRIERALRSLPQPVSVLVDDDLVRFRGTAPPFTDAEDLGSTSGRGTHRDDAVHETTKGPPR